jgi:hypothetical protein
MPYDLVADITKEIASKQAYYLANKVIIEELDRLEPVWEAFMPGKIFRNTPLYLSAHVERLKDIEPVLALLTHDELSFTDSGDKYAANKNRDYSRSDGLKVWVYVSGANCRKEVVGTESVPIYKLVCDDEVPSTLLTPDAGIPV